MMLIRLIILSLLGLATVVRAQENLPPYLYYYSEAVDAFVIERADGTDRYTFGEGVIPSDTRTVSYLQWSPSGEWFSWISAGDPYEYSRNFSTPGVMHIDGTRRFEFLDEIIGGSRLSWSPTEDFILVGGRTTEDDNSSNNDTPVDYVFYLIDAPNEQIITQFTLQTERYGLESPDWTPDGSYATIAYTDAESGQRFLRKISRTGQISDQASTRLGTFGVSSNNTTWNLNLSEDGSKLIATNLITDQALEFDTPDATPDGYYMTYWHQSGDYALVLTRGSEEEGRGLWLLSLPDKRLEQLSNDMAYWVYDGGLVVYHLWSLYDPIAAFITTEGELFLVEVSPIRLTRLLDETVDVGGASWFIHGSQLLFYYEEGETSKIGLYDHETGEITDVSDNHFDYIRTSPSYRYTVSQYPYGLYDETTGELLPLPSGENYGSPDRAYVNWSTDEAWMLLTHVGGGTFPPQHMLVSSIDNSISRELSDKSDANWLPPRAEAALDQLRD